MEFPLLDWSPQPRRGSILDQAGGKLANTAQDSHPTKKAEAK
jgi:hypothetical protein